MSRQVFIHLGGQRLEVFRLQRRKGLDDENAFRLQNFVLDHVWFTAMKAKNATTGISRCSAQQPDTIYPRGGRTVHIGGKSRRGSAPVVAPGAPSRVPGRSPAASIYIRF